MINANAFLGTRYDAARNATSHAFGNRVAGVATVFEDLDCLTVHYSGDDLASFPYGEREAAYAMAVALVSDEDEVG